MSNIKQTKPPKIIAKRKKKKKTKSVADLHNQAAELLQKLVRLKASDDNGYCACVTCGVVKRWNNGMQGGHFMPRGRAATKLMEENIHPQCEGCNGFGMKFHGAAQAYTIYMIDMYGRDEVDRLMQKSLEVHKWYRCDIEDQIKEFKDRIKVEEDRIA